MEYIQAKKIYEIVRRIKYLQDLLVFGYDTNRPNDIIEISETREDLKYEITGLKKMIEKI